MSDRWDVVVDTSEKKGFINLKQIWHYKDLLILLVRRDFVAFYKQTILGPIWFFIKPIVSSIVYFFIFGQVAGISTDGLPPALFYISGLILWGFFTDIVNNCGNVFIINAPIFGKVYFPRLIMPISIVFSSLLKLIVQLLLLFLIYSYFLFITEELTISFNIFLVPLVILFVSLQALGLGILVAAMATKYRDFYMLLGYVLQIGLFLTPVVFPFSTLTGKFKVLISFNPMTYPVELFRIAFFGTGTITTNGILYSIGVTFIILFVGLNAFNKAEKTFVDLI